MQRISDLYKFIFYLLTLKYHVCSWQVAHIASLEIRRVWRRSLSGFWFLIISRSRDNLLTLRTKRSKKLPQTTFFHNYCEFWTDEASRNTEVDEIGETCQDKCITISTHTLIVAEATCVTASCGQIVHASSYIRNVFLVLFPFHYALAIFCRPAFAC